MKHARFASFDYAKAWIVAMLLPIGMLSSWSPTALAGEAERARRVGLTALEDGMYATAVEAFEEYVRYQDTGEVHPETLLLWCRALYGLGEYERIIELVGLHTTDRVDTPELQTAFLMTKARARAAIDGAGEALDLLGKRPKQTDDPELELQALYLETSWLLQLERTEEALEVAERLAGLFPGAPGHPAYLLDWADRLLEQREQEGALLMLERLLQQHPEAPEARDALLWKAQIYLDNQTPVRAAALLEERLIEPPPGTTALDARVAFVHAQALFEMADYASVVGVLDQALSGPVETDMAWKARGLRAAALIRAGHATQGVEAMRRWVAANIEAPDASPMLLAASFDLLALEEYEHAASLFQSFLETFPDDDQKGRALWGRALSLHRIERHAEAATTFERAFDLLDEPDLREEALLHAGDAYFALEQFARARQAYVDFEREFPDSERLAHALYLQARALAQLDETPRAEELFRSIQQRFPGSDVRHHALIHVARLRERRGDLSGALETYTRVVENQPPDDLAIRALHGRALLRYRLGLFPEALEDFEQVARTAPNGPLPEQAFYMRGWTLYLMERSTEALAVCREFIRRFPESQWAPDVLFWLAEYHFNQGDYPQAEGVFLELAEQYPQKELADDALYWAGRAAAAQHEYLRAIEHYNRLAAQYPQSSILLEARFAQGDALSELGQFAGAILAFEEIIRQDPDSYLANLARGRKGDCQYTLGSDNPARYAEAIQTYSSLLARQDISPELAWQVEYKIGRCEEKLDNPDRALAHYKRVCYNYLAHAGPTTAVGALWFTRAAFSAGAILEEQKRWREALRIYERVVQAGVPAAREAQARIRTIQQNHWFLLGH